MNFMYSSCRKNRGENEIVKKRVKRERVLTLSKESKCLRIKYIPYFECLFLNRRKKEILIK